MLVVRTVDPEQHRLRRLVIIDAALTRFAADGYHGATTNAICAEAGIGSGTFFHYFPTKLQLLLAILELGTSETDAWFLERADRDDARGVIDEYVEHLLEEYGDPRIAGFVKAVGAVMAEPLVHRALTHDADTVRRHLTWLVARAQEAGEVGTELGPARAARWLAVLFDGFLDQVAMDPGFDLTDEAPMLRAQVGRLLAG